MITEIDDALRSLLRAHLTGDASEVEIAFDQPDEEWASRQNGPTVNLYLYDVSENLARREMMYEAIRDESGRVVERRPPPRRFDLAYLVSAWTQRAEDEHRLVDTLLSTLLSYEVIPDEHLDASLRDHPLPIRLVAGRPRPDERKATDIWSAVGGPLKPSIDLLVTTPFVTGRTREAGPPVTETPRFDIAGDGSRRDAGDPQTDAAARRERGRASDDNDGLAHEVVHGGPPGAEEKGRMLTVREVPRP